MVYSVGSVVAVLVCVLGILYGVCVLWNRRTGIGSESSESPDMTAYIPYYE